MKNIFLSNGLRLIACSLWLFTGSLLHSAETPQELEVSVMPYTLRDGEHEAAFPLRLTITVSNLSSARALDKNKANLQMRDTLRRSGKMDSMTPAEIKKLNDTYPSTLIPVLEWGTAKAPLSSLVTFEITDAAGKTLPGKVRPLAVTRDLKGSVKLDGVQLAVLEFGLDADQMKGWPIGTVSIKAKIDHNPQRSGKTSIVFKNDSPWFWQKDARVRRAYLTGLYYRMDAQWKQMEASANEILELKSDSPFGWELKGEAAMANKKYTEAEQAFRKAMDGSMKMQKDLGETSPEFPVYHANRLAAATYLKKKTETSKK